ncbi:hypothetical protein [Streptomyces sp. RKAG290]|uniref:hypothetical protein n=1 Tax=Streptomyces sp. RKAG290 TaxID=2888348 RepID=UPI002033C9D9|nr:hypothetical protein [Streptomyces sp. RKAG290]MCM2416078.1 hypothetical protein [Streptomyces sp. RKAG290]
MASGPGTTLLAEQIVGVVVGRLRRPTSRLSLPALALTAPDAPRPACPLGRGPAGAPGAAG